MNKKILSIVIIILLAAFAIIRGNYSQTNDIATQKMTVKIGVTLPLTGDISVLGQDNKNAIMLAYERLGETKYNYELIFEDDQFKPSVGASTVNKLISIDGVSAVISFGSPVGNVVSSITEKSKVPHVNDFASDPHVADGEYNFVHYTPSYEDSRVFVAELEKRGIKKLVFFGQSDNPGVVAIIDAFEKDIKNSDIQVLSTQKFNTGTRDFRTMISKVKDLNLDIYVLEASTPELETLTKQLRDAGIKTPVTSMEAFEFSDQLSLFEGMWYVNAADPEQWFVDLFKNKYGSIPRFGSANGYDSFNLIVQAIEKSGDGKTIPSGEQIKNSLAGIKGFDGALGKGLNIDGNGIVVSKPVVRVIQNGVPVTLK
ncbi:MAG: ABC transporter substrate-binding protein [Patescibacteria group bacterium]